MPSETFQGIMVYLHPLVFKLGVCPAQKAKERERGKDRHMGKTRLHAAYKYGHREMHEAYSTFCCLAACSATISLRSSFSSWDCCSRTVCSYLACIAAVSKSSSSGFRATSIPSAVSRSPAFLPACRKTSFAYYVQRYHRPKNIKSNSQ